VGEAGFSMSIFLHNSGKYYFRLHIPLDLREYFGNREDIAQSLKTKDKAEALVLSAGLQQKYGVVFSHMPSSCRPIQKFHTNLIG
jgi:hypothetical protein